MTADPTAESVERLSAKCAPHEMEDALGTNCIVSKADLRNVLAALQAAEQECERLKAESGRINQLGKETFGVACEWQHRAETAEAKLSALEKAARPVAEAGVAGIGLTVGHITALRQALAAPEPRSGDVVGKDANRDLRSALWQTLYPKFFLNKKALAGALDLMLPVFSAYATAQAAHAVLGRAQSAPEGLDWSGTFKVHDPDPGDDHGPIYLQCPDGLLVNFSCHAAPGVDAARVQWVVNALNAALATSPVQGGAL